MSNMLGDGEDEAAPGSGDDARVNRRDALRKAAIALGTAGVVWTAPRIEGLSMVPDYASAGTLMATFMVTVNQIDCSNNVTRNANCWGACQPDGNNCTTGVRAFDIGGERINITGTGSADTNGDGTLTVSFASMDPPFNMCQVNALSGVPGPGPTGQDQNLSGNTATIDQSPVNQGTSVTFTIVCT